MVIISGDPEAKGATTQGRERDGTSLSVHTGKESHIFAHLWHNSNHLSLPHIQRRLPSPVKPRAQSGERDTRRGSPGVMRQTHATQTVQYREIQGEAHNIRKTTVITTRVHADPHQNREEELQQDYCCRDCRSRCESESGGWRQKSGRRMDGGREEMTASDLLGCRCCSCRQASKQTHTHPRSRSQEETATAVKRIEHQVCEARECDGSHAAQAASRLVSEAIDLFVAIRQNSDNGSSSLPSCRRRRRCRRCCCRK